MKFGLGFTSLFFDAIFIAQHFWLYRGAPDPATVLEANAALDEADSSDDGGIEAGSREDKGVSSGRGLRQPLLGPGEAAKASAETHTADKAGQEVASQV